MRLTFALAVFRLDPVPKLYLVSIKRLRRFTVYSRGNVYPFLGPRNAIVSYHYLDRGSLRPYLVRHFGAV